MLVVWNCPLEKRSAGPPTGSAPDVFALTDVTSNAGSRGSCARTRRDGTTPTAITTIVRSTSGNDTRGVFMTASGSAIQLLRCKRRAVGKGLQLRPRNLRVHTESQAAIGAGNDIHTANESCEADDAVGDELRMLDDIGRVADDTRDENFSVRQRRRLPELPLVLVARVGSLDRVGTRLHFQHEIENVLEWQIVRMRAVPAAPADVITDPILGQPLERVIERVNSHFCELPVL